MGKKRSGRAVRVPSRVVFPLGRFLALLHQCIGGSGPLGVSSATECPAFRRDHPDHALEVGDFRVEYLWSHIMRKYDDRVKTTTKRDSALHSLMEAEKQCATSYASFKRYRKDLSDFPTLGRITTMDTIIHIASRKILSVLGEFKWVDALDYVGFGPGATTNLPRSRADLWYKFEAVPQASSSCAPLVRCYLGRRAPLWKRSLIRKWGITYSICDANQVTTVPKNYLTDRPIAIEPQWNMFFQKGIGGLIRSRLKKVGVDLDDQRRNRELALAGSNDGSIATVDLSNASDTVARWLVHELLPADWITAMERCRSLYSVLPSGERILLRKFSSMGNGFTFELESLIFWALSSTITQLVRKDRKLKDPRVSIYGDDIIIPADCYGPLVEALTACGFSVNAEKSYHEGPFRESCGMHAFSGHDVTPFYIREPVDNLTDLFLLHNNLVRWSQLRYSSARDKRLQKLCSWVRSFAPQEWRKPRICDGYGDGAFIGSFDEVIGNSVVKNGSKRGFQGISTEIMVEKPFRYDRHRAERDRKRHGQRTSPPLFEDYPRLLRTLWNLRLTTEQAEIRPDAPHDVSISRGVYVPKRIHVWMWTEMGPWIDFHDSADIRKGVCENDAEDPAEEPGTP